MTDADAMLDAMRADAESDWPTRLMAAMARRSTPENGSPLTRGELDALRAMSYGLIESESATVLGTTPDGIASKLRQARRKLRAKNTTHAVALAIRQGYLS